MNLNEMKALGFRPYTWRDKYEIDYCDTCDHYVVICPDCRNKSCIGSGCENCKEDFNYFDVNVTKSIYEYISDTELLFKISYLKKYILDSISNNEDVVNWKKMRDEGKMSEYSEKLFKEYLETTEYTDKKI